jgi:hypothetical protein
VGCKKDDALGTRAIIMGNPPAGLTRTGSCSPDEKNIVFFYETADKAAMDDYVASKVLEVGVGDAVVRDGSVLMLVTDAATAMNFSEKFDQLNL